MAHALRISRAEHEQATGSMGARPPPSEEELAAQAVARAAQEKESREREQLRAEQAAEYEESLRVDQEREAQKAAKLAEEAEARRREAGLAAEEAKAEEAKKAVVAAKADEARRQLESSPEPDAGEADRIAIALRLPDGKRLKRAFRGTDTVALIYSFVDASDSEAVAGAGYRLVETMPRRVFEERACLLKDAGLQSQCALLIELVDP